MLHWASSDNFKHIIAFDTIKLMKVVYKRFKAGARKADGSLDYAFHLQEKVEKEVACEDKMLQIAVTGEQDVNVIGTLLWSIATCNVPPAVNSWYYKYAIGSKTHLIIAEIGDEWILVRFNNSGRWPAIFKSVSVNYSDMLTFKDKFRSYALWDNEQWYAPDPEELNWFK